MATNYGTKLTTTRPPWKIIARCFHLLLLYEAARLYSVATGHITSVPTVHCTARVVCDVSLSHSALRKLGAAPRVSWGWCGKIHHTQRRQRLRQLEGRTVARSVCRSRPPVEDAEFGSDQKRWLDWTDWAPAIAMAWPVSHHRIALHKSLPQSTI